MRMPVVLDVLCVDSRVAGCIEVIGVLLGFFSIPFIFGTPHVPRVFVNLFLVCGFDCLAILIAIMWLCVRMSLCSIFDNMQGI